MMTGLGNWIRRARHRRGFGVHSPLAFQVVKEVLWPSSGYGFYLEAAIARQAPARLRRTLLRAWRLSCWQRLPLQVVGELPLGLRGLLAERAPSSPSEPYLRLVLQPGDGPEICAVTPSHHDADVGSLSTPAKDGGIHPVPDCGILYMWSGKRPERSELLPGELLLILSDGFIAFSRPDTPRLCYDF